MSRLASRSRGVSAASVTPRTWDHVGGVATPLWNECQCGFACSFSAATHDPVEIIGTPHGSMTRRVSRGHDCGCGAGSSRGNQSIAFLRTRLSCPQPRRHSKAHVAFRWPRLQERRRLQNLTVASGWSPQLSLLAVIPLVISTARHCYHNEANQASQILPPLPFQCRNRSPSRAALCSVLTTATSTPSVPASREFPRPRCQ